MITLFFEPLQNGLKPRLEKGAHHKGETGKRRKSIMYAIIVTGGKQYKVEVGSEIMVEKLDNEVGDKVSFDILMIADGSDIEIGKPVLSGVSAKGEVLEHGKGKKVIVSSISPRRITAKSRAIVSPTPRSRSFPSAER